MILGARRRKKGGSNRDELDHKKSKIEEKAKTKDNLTVDECFFAHERAIQMKEIQNESDDDLIFPPLIRARTVMASIPEPEPYYNLRKRKRGW